MITGFTQNVRFKEALKLFFEMKLMGIRANSKTFVSLLPACAGLEYGMEIHQEIIQSGFQFRCCGDDCTY